MQGYSSSDQYENRFFKFYPLSQFVTVKDECFEWEGIPNYRNIIKTMPFHESCYVFSDYVCDSFTYAIQLYREVNKINECRNETKAKDTSHITIQRYMQMTEQKLLLSVRNVILIYSTKK